MIYQLLEKLFKFSRDELSKLNNDELLLGMALPLANFIVALYKKDMHHLKKQLLLTGLTLG